MIDFITPCPANLHVTLADRNAVVKTQLKAVSVRRRLKFKAPLRPNALQRLEGI
jgi:hypothetical protein